MSNFCFCDAHTDFLTELNNKQIKQYLNLLSSFKRKLISCAFFTTDKHFTINKILKLNNLIKGQAGLMLSIEDIGFIKGEKQLKQLIKLKPISVTLTWNFNNQYAGGAMDNGTLTPQGKNAIKLLENSGVIVDTAHLNKRSFYAFRNITTKPIYCSHANIYSLYKHRRNLTDKQIKLIRDSDGFLGLTIYQKFISKNKISALDVAKQIDYLIKNFGCDFFGFGTDLFGFSPAYLPTDINNYLDLKKVAHHLKTFGYTTKTINKIFYQNYINFIKKLKKY